MKKILSVIILLILVWGCSTFPKPDSENDTMLIIPVEVSMDSSHDWFGKYRIDISRYRDGETIKTILVPIKNGEIIRTKLEPGRYYIKRSVFVYDSTHEVSWKTIAEHTNVEFILKAGTVTVLPSKFKYKIFDKGADSWGMNRAFESLSLQEQQDLLLKYENHDSFSLWKNDIL